jgi:hypothetical protein
MTANVRKSNEGQAESGAGTMAMNQLLYDYYELLRRIERNGKHLKTERNTAHRESLKDTIAHLENEAEGYRERIRAAGLDPNMHPSEAMHLMTGAIVANVRKAQSAAELLYTARKKDA